MILHDGHLGNRNSDQQPHLKGVYVYSGFNRTIRGEAFKILGVYATKPLPEVVPRNHRATPTVCVLALCVLNLGNFITKYLNLMFELPKHEKSQDR